MARGHKARMTGPFGRLTVLREAPTPEHVKNKVLYYLCRCTCGKECVVAGGHLRRKKGATRSCGCLAAESAREVGGRLRLPAEVVMINRHMLRYTNMAKTYGRAFELTRDHFERMVRANCHYCGSPPMKPIYEGGAAYKTPERRAQLFNGVDRVDSDRGYTTDNVVACCTFCNYAKRHAPVAEFEAYLDRGVALRPKRAS